MSNNRKVKMTITEIEPILSLDFEEKDEKEEKEEKKVRYSEIGHGFNREEFTCQVEYYWNPDQKNLCRRVPNPTSYSEAAFSGTLVIGRIIPKKVETIKYEPKEIEPIKPKPDVREIFAKYKTTINNVHDRKTSSVQLPAYVPKRKHKSSKRKKPVKHFKMLETLKINYDDDYDDYYDYYSDYNDDDDDYYGYNDGLESYDYLQCRGPYSENLSKCFGLCCN
jgi:hypothetical protein